MMRSVLLQPEQKRNEKQRKKRIASPKPGSNPNGRQKKRQSDGKHKKPRRIARKGKKRNVQRLQPPKRNRYPGDLLSALQRSLYLSLRCLGSRLSLIYL